MATEKKDLVAEEAEDKKIETSAPKEAESQPEQKTSEPAQEKPAEEKSESAPEKKPEGTKSKEETKKPEIETKKPETPEMDSGESEAAASTIQDYFAASRKDLPDLKPGDIIRIFYRVIEGGKERIQAYEGTVIAMKNSGISKTITVRKTSFGIAVERIFPLNSKLIQKIEVKKHSKVRRAKLYYLRKLKGKAARLKELR